MCLPPSSVPWWFQHSRAGCPTQGNSRYIGCHAGPARNSPQVLAQPQRLTHTLIFWHRANNLSIQNLQTLVVDEADLVLSFGYAEDIRYIVSQMPRICQVSHQHIQFSVTHYCLKQRICQSQHAQVGVRCTFIDSSVYLFRCFVDFLCC